jgi:anti-sigma factor ChrR (cupin superfamily)
MKAHPLAVAALLGPTVASHAQTPPAAKPAHVWVVPAELRWAEGPPALPKGMQLAVIAGNPGEAGPFVVRAKLPAGYKIPPHWHPTAENVTILEGTMSFGMGDTFDQAALKEFGPGGFTMMPPDMRHYAWSKGGATIQVHGTGPFTLTYVNPKDDPRNAAPAAAK